MVVVDIWAKEMINGQEILTKLIERIYYPQYGSPAGIQMLDENINLLVALTMQGGFRMLRNGKPFPELEPLSPLHVPIPDEALLCVA